jgi:hypothetical protein
MEYPLSEIIDRMAIQKLKIERIGEMQLSEEFKELEFAFEDFKKKGIKINPRWLIGLYEINGKIWDNEFMIRKIAHGITEDNIVNLSDEELVEIGRRYLEVGNLMKERDRLKNEIVEKTGHGFKIVKMEHSAE